MVYHRGIEKVLYSGKSASKFGQLIHCGDGKPRIVHFSVLTLSLDLEEAWYLTLTRGVKSNFGVCPICLCPGSEQHDIGKHWPRRTTENRRHLYNEVESLLQQPRNKGRVEDLLMKEGQYQIQVSCRAIDLDSHVHVPCASDNRMLFGISTTLIRTKQSHMIYYTPTTSGSLNAYSLGCLRNWKVATCSVGCCNSGTMRS